MGRLASIRLCCKIIRLHILAGGFLGYCLGVLLAMLRGGKTSPQTPVLGYLIVLFGDLSTHFSNDYYDVDVDENAPHKTFEGHNILVDYPDIKPLAISSGIFLSAASLLIALFMVLKFSASPSLLCLVITTNLFGWLYSTPSVTLNARGLGEITVALGTGLSIPAIGYMVTLGNLDKIFLFFSIPLILYGFNLSLSLELPDLEVDREYRKINLVVLLGRRKITFLIFLTSMLASAFFIFLVKVDVHRFWLLPILSFFPIITSLKGYFTHSYSQVKANNLSILNISALFFFLVALDCYLAFPLLT